MSEVLIKDFSKFLEDTNKSHSTVIAYAKDLSQLMEYVGKDLHEVQKDELKKVVDTMKEGQQFTPKTISRKINSYRTFYKYLNSTGKINHDPTVDVKHPKLSPRAPRILSPMEYLALREVSRDNARLYTMIELMLQGGIRIGELSRLKLKHVNIQKNKVTLFIERYASTDERTITLNAKGAQLISDYLKKHPGDYDEYPLFATRDGNHIIIRNIRSSVDRAMAKAGIQKACVNDLRNTFIVMQLTAGVPVEQVANFVGHKSKTTTNKYVDLVEGEYKPQADAKLADL